MKKLLVSTLIASGLAISGAGAFALEEQPKDAQTEQHMQKDVEHGAKTSTEVRGEVTNVEGTTVEIKDETGKAHSFDTAGLKNLEEFEGQSIKPGDAVRVEIADGKAILIEKVEAKSDASSENSSATTAANPIDDEGVKRDHNNSMPEEALEGKEQPETAVEEEYVVKQGDTLGDIAEEQLGSKEEWKLIARANNIDNPDKIYVGQRLSIPSNTNSGSQELNEQQAPNSDETEPMKDNTENVPATENY